MSENPSGRKAEDPAPGMTPAQTESQLRLVTEDDAAIFPQEAPTTDEAPTIISKNPPAAQTATAIKATSPEMLLGSLRGRKLAHFELIEPIGVGGMAAVLRARDTQLDRSVALKILPPDMANDEENILRFHQEARAAAKLDHENIARVFYCGEDQRLNFIAFEFVDGENLRTILERRGRLPVAEAVRYVLQIAAGLEHAASRGVVHRDVKPSNIIIMPNGRAKLVDMGLARNVEPQTNQLTHSGMTLGTFDYISPEQALEPRDADARSDIYSLGCTFYHMLTGQPPVPEGTAAKKVHHHQHVAPIDPRQLNSEIPDEVALILHKMMAKNPKDRYQRPVHLVQHLMEVAGKVGAAADIPDGVLFVDAPLLAPPRKRPLLLVSVGALALAVVLMVLSLASPHKAPPRSPGSKDDGARSAANGSNPTVKPGGNSSLPVKGPTEIASEDDLFKLFADNTSPTVQATVVKSFEITRPGLLFQGGELKRSLILEGRLERNAEDDSPFILPGSMPMLTWKYEAHDSDQVEALMILDGGKVTFKNLRFSVEAALPTKQTAEAMGDLRIPKHAVAGIAVRGASTVRFVQCQFEQPEAPPPPYIELRHLGQPIASILVYGAAGNKDRPQIDLQQCVFKSGQVAVGVQSPADIVASQCAFMPHGAMFHLHGDGDSKITVNHCSGLAVTGPVFRLDDNASCKLQIDYSIFSCPSSTVSSRDAIHLIHQTDSKEARVSFVPWKRNCYHNLNAMWSRGVGAGDPIFTTLEDFQREIVAYNGRDVQSSALNDSIQIWQDPAPHTKKVATRAFKLKDDVPQVRTADKKLPLGVDRNDLMDVALASFKEEPMVAEMNPTPGERIVDPDGRTPGAYRTVSSALHAAIAGDVIRIKHGKNRELNVVGADLKQSGVNVTLRPYDENYQPILTLANTLEPNAYFFRLHDGSMLFEQLEIVLEPDQPGFNSQALALMAGNASCTFKKCIITLKQNAAVNPNRSVPLSVVALSEIDDAMMKMGTKQARAAAEAIFENCFIRGEGEVVTNLAGRPLDLRLDNTLVGLTGSLLTMHAGPKESAPDTQVKLSLQHSSVFTTEPMLVARQAKNRPPKGLLPLRVDRALHCLFSALEDKPLIATEYPDLGDATLRNHFDWKGSGNVYSGYDVVLDDPGLRLDPMGWRESFYKDSAEARFLRATFRVPPAPRSLWTSAPDDFKPSAEFQDKLQRSGASFDDVQLPPVQ